MSTTSPIYGCTDCGYSTRDPQEAAMINDLTGRCPRCGADAHAAPNGAGVWTADTSWYDNLEAPEFDESEAHA